MVHSCVQDARLAEKNREVTELRAKLMEANLITEDAQLELSAKAAELDNLRFKLGNFQTLETRAKLAEDELEVLRVTAAKMERYVKSRPIRAQLTTNRKKRRKMLKQRKTN